MSSLKTSISFEAGKVYSFDTRLQRTDTKKATKLIPFLSQLLKSNLVCIVMLLLNKRAEQLTVHFDWIVKQFVKCEIYQNQRSTLNALKIYLFLQVNYCKKKYQMLN
jgi:hypothetical protein